MPQRRIQRGAAGAVPGTGVAPRRAVPRVQCRELRHLRAAVGVRHAGRGAKHPSPTPVLPSHQLFPPVAAAARGRRAGVPGQRRIGTRATPATLRALRAGACHDGLGAEHVTGRRRRRQ